MQTSRLRFERDVVWQGPGQLMSSALYGCIVELQRGGAGRLSEISGQNPYDPPVLLLMALAQQVHRGTSRKIWQLLTLPVSIRLSCGWRVSR